MNNSRYGKTKVHQVNSIEDRVKLIGDQVDASQRDSFIRHLSLEIVSGLPQHGPESEDAEIVQVFNFVKRNIEYRQDPRDYDYYASAKRTLQMRAGDCDDHVILVAALLHNLGFATGAKVISPDGRNWHIYALAGVNTRAEPSAVVPLDTTQVESYPGWEPGAMHRAYEHLATFTQGNTIIKKLR